MAGHLTGVYLHVVADVINNVREDFINEGVDEAVLQELQSLWELNMMQSGTIQGCHADLYPRGVGGHPTPASVHDLNMPYEGETPTAELLFPPTPVHTPLPTFTASGPSSEHPDTLNSSEMQIGRPAPFMQPSPWVHQTRDINIAMNPKLDMNVAYEGGDEEEPINGSYLVTQEFLTTSIGKRKREDDITSGIHFAQNDGAGDQSDVVGDLLSASSASEKAHQLLLTAASSAEGGSRITTGNDKQKDKVHLRAGQSRFPQFDGGIDDNYNDVVAEEDYNEPEEEDVPTFEQVSVDSKYLQPLSAEDLDQSEPPLNEDDDLNEGDGFDEGDETLQTNQVVYAQYEKVNRAKNKWKCILKDGIMHLNQRDFLFSRVT